MYTPQFIVSITPPCDTAGNKINADSDYLWKTPVSLSLWINSGIWAVAANNGSYCPYSTL
ncbi:nickel-dependent hydrogenase B-type cytochrome subunit [Mobiluncus curtisii]|uniref:Uncharacterized protein n=2 Tax=Mobiluncus curtisii TaxID=2051 RepID=D6ZL50_MOBCV|nr:hypothetical protein HMPREF0573_11130 [Mobiluncus curtisii ATCC 43063]MCU9987584.1 nickel-dependent hydrogenase B-type cytochrome subunit [Mobiluncus curtisii]MCV0000734.1 nickel-dependent hydrogenase B-type cytochrome subunit [Mobiluncus curtisii]MCV0020425.1 nickel-dependent hydrogenase B-type cytochrome subunit [Mobiluncus curtisii]NMW43318.1 nickel-dependent hydrogenase B-type cytochrome subunit [Mobiluncus curtisii]